MDNASTKIRVLVIDPEDRSITESFVSSLEDMQAIVGGNIELVVKGPGGHEVYCNEEAMLSPQHFFGIRDRACPVPLPLAGKSFIIGPADSNGENQGATMSPEDALKGILWLDMPEAALAAAIIAKIQREETRAFLRSQGAKDSQASQNPKLHIVH